MSRKKKATKKKATKKKATKKKTRLKGTEHRKPCFDCGKMKDRLKSFRPRWAGCINHRTERGRRYHEPGCEECEKAVNGRIRQPRCIQCDAKRPKQRKKKDKAPEPTPEVTEPEPEVTEPEVPEPEVPEPEVEETEPTPEATEPTPEVEVTEEPEDEPTVVAMEELAPESVMVPEPEVTDPERPKIATVADLSALFEDSDEE